MDVNQTYYDHFALYANIKLHCTPDTNIMLCKFYLSQKEKAAACLTALKKKEIDAAGSLQSPAPGLYTGTLSFQQSSSELMQQEQMSSQYLHNLIIMACQEDSGHSKV